MLLHVNFSQGEADFPARLSPVVTPGGSNGACPADEVLTAQPPK